MHALTLGTFVFFTALVGLLTWLLTRHDRHDTSDGYFLGGRTLTSGYIAGSLLLTNLSTEQLIGLNGAAFKDGLSVMAWEVIAGMSLVVMALIFLPRYLKSGIATIPQFLELRFSATTRAITSLIFIIAYGGILLPIILYSGATGLNSILDVQSITGLRDATTTLWFTVWLVGIIGSIYAIFGGLRTVAVSDTLNGFGLLVGGGLITWYAFHVISPGAPLQALGLMLEQHPEKFNSLGGPQQSVPFSTLFTGVLLLNLFYWCTNQQIIQRTFGASSLQEGQKGVLLAGMLKVLAPIILVFPGIAAFHLFGTARIEGLPGTIQDVITEPVAITGQFTPADPRQQHKAAPLTLYGPAAFEALQLTVQKEPPSGEEWERLQEREGTEVQLRNGRFDIVKVLRQGDVILADAEGSALYHSGLSEAELHQLLPPRKQDQAYGKLVRHVLPPWLTGFLAAAIVGAILSSFNSALNSTATLFSLGVYRSMLRPQADDKQVIISGKVFGTIIALIAMTVAPLLAGQTSLFGYLQKMNGLYFIPIFAVVLIGMFTRRVPAKAANTALLLGFSVMAAGYFIPACAVWVDHLHEFHFMGIVFISLIALMLLIGKFAPRATPWQQETSNSIDLTPWPYAIPAGLVLVTTVLGIYIWFANPAAILS